MRRSGLSLVGPTVVHIYSCAIQTQMTAVEKCLGAGRCNGRRAHGESQGAQRCCDGGLSEAENMWLMGRAPLSVLILS
jgi:hypothetical protein